MAHDAVQEIKERLSIVDIVSAYVQLTPAGKSLKGKSPFTQEKTPSFFVSPEREMYYCFSSGKGGDMFTFIEEMEGVDFKGALKILAEKAGVSLVAEDPKKRNEKDKLYEVLEAATKFFETKRHSYSPAIDYLKKRGLTESTIDKWRIGYAPGPPESGWRELKVHLEGKGYDTATQKKAGLVKGEETGKEPYDVFRDRVMFPLFDASGRVVAFSGRLLSKDSEAPKYVNSPETELYNKSELLFGYDRAKEGIRKLGFSLVVEGQFDVVMSHQAGYHNTVAVSGTALTPHHVGLLGRLSNRVVLALDSDRAGLAAVKRAADLMLPLGMDVKVAALPEGSDPADLVHKDPALFKKAIGQAKHVIEFLLDVLKASIKDDRSYKLRVREEVLPTVYKIPSTIDREHFVGVIAERLGATVDAVRIELERISERDKHIVNQDQKITEVSPARKKDSSLSRQESLKAYLVAVSEVADGSIASNLKERLEKFTDRTITELLSDIDVTERSRLQFMVEESMETMSKHQFCDELAVKLSEFARLLITVRIAEYQEALKLAEYEEDEERVLQLLTEISFLHKAKTQSVITAEDLMK